MALQLNGTDGVTFNDGSEQWAAASPIGTKNLIINGNMQIAQRGTSSAGNTGNGYTTVDRFYNWITAAGTWTMSQDSDVPTGQGFSDSFKMACTTANASLGSTGRFAILQIIEGQNLQNLKWGTANAESITLSFWIKSNKTGTYTLVLNQANSVPATWHIAKTFTIDSADTWEKKTLTISGNTSTDIRNSNEWGLRVIIYCAGGSNFTSGTLATSWEAQVIANAVSSSNVNLADSTSNYINITGVQLEVGDTATPFEHRPYDMELARCQRYYYLVDDRNGASNQVIGAGFMYDTTRARVFVTFPTTMRILPSVVSTNIASSIEFNVNSNSLYGPSFSLPFGTAGNTIGAMVQITADSGSGTAGQARYVRYRTTYGAKLSFDAEL